MTGYHQLPIGFRTLPCGPLIRFSPRQAQYRKLAAAFARWRVEGRSPLALEVVLETGIEQWQGRRSELKDMGFVIEAHYLPNARVGDRRQVYRLAANVVIVWEPEEAENGHAGN